MKRKLSVEQSCQFTGWIYPHHLWPQAVGSDLKIEIVDTSISFLRWASGLLLQIRWHTRNRSSTLKGAGWGGWGVCLDASKVRCLRHILLGGDSGWTGEIASLGCHWNTSVTLLKRWRWLRDGGVGTSAWTADPAVQTLISYTGWMDVCTCTSCYLCLQIVLVDEPQSKLHWNARTQSQVASDCVCIMTVFDVQAEKLKNSGMFCAVTTGSQSLNTLHPDSIELEEQMLAM